MCTYCSDYFATRVGEQYPVPPKSPTDGEQPNKTEHPSGDCVVYAPTASAVGEIETVCISTDTAANNQSGETAAITNATGENVYSEISPPSQLREHATPSGGTKESAGSELKSTRAPNSLGLAGEHEKTCACPEEALYDQPVSLTRTTEKKGLN